MTDRDFPAFVNEFKRLAAALDSYKRTPEEVSAKADAYFHVLKKYPLADVIAKADAWLQTETKMPKPAEWAGITPKRPPVELRVLTDADARTYRRAESLGYEDEPCACALCVHAGVHEKPLRFVPEFDADDVSVKVKDPIGDRVVIAGHWAHGRELFAYYDARANFWNRMYQLGLVNAHERQKAEREPLWKRLELLFSKREAPVDA